MPQKEHPPATTEDGAYGALATHVAKTAGAARQTTASMASVPKEERPPIAPIAVATTRTVAQTKDGANGALVKHAAQTAGAASQTTASMAIVPKKERLSTTRKTTQRKRKSARTKDGANGASATHAAPMTGAANLTTARMVIVPILTLLVSPSASSF